jgi:hypothetical protein
MATSQYLAGRQRYQRPQAILFADNPGTIVDGIYVPDGYESGSSEAGPSSFIILSDHNRGAIDFSTTRIEERMRLVTGKMRSYYIADKLNLNLSWSLLPSRSHQLSPSYDDAGVSTALEYTADGGAGGVDLLNWYENHKGSFWVYLAYDKLNNFESDTNPYAHLNQYNQVVEMFISNFDYSVQKRGGTNYDMWNVNISLEEA